MNGYETLKRQYNPTAIHPSTLYKRCRDQFPDWLTSTRSGVASGDTAEAALPSEQETAESSDDVPESTESTDQNDAPKTMPVTMPRLDGRNILYRPMLQTLAADLDANLEPLRQQADIIAEAVRDKAHDFDPELPPRAESDLEPPDESAWLFDSRRGYFDQLAAYTNEKGPAAVTTEPLLTRPPANNLEPSTRPGKAP